GGFADAEFADVVWHSPRELNGKAVPPKVAHASSVLSSLGRRGRQAGSVRYVKSAERERERRAAHPESHLQLAFGRRLAGVSAADHSGREILNHHGSGDSHRFPSDRDTRSDKALSSDPGAVINPDRRVPIT